jgi:uncharacterized protein YicC (UPF0701 family)
MDKYGDASTSTLAAKLIETLGTSRNTKDKEGYELCKEIRQALDELETIRSYFDTVQEPELIDYAIYREKSVLVRLSYLIKKARSRKGV